MIALRFALLLLFAAPLLGQPASDDWRIENHTWKQELPAGLPIEIDNPYGEIRVRAFDWQGCELIGVSQRHREDPRPIELTPLLEAERLVLAVRMPASELDATAPTDWALRRVDLTIYVPASSPLAVRTRQGYLEVKGSTAPLTVETDGGAVLLESHGPFAARSTAGEIAVLLAEPAWGHEATIDTETGAVRLAVRRDARARLEVETRGRIATDFSIDIEREGAAAKRGRAILGDGAGVVRVRTHQGDVTLAEEAIVE